VIANSRSRRRFSDLPAIVDAFDGLMVARGDLGVEMPLEQIAGAAARHRAVPPGGQAGHRGDPELDSMISDRRPTRAEVSDVANAVFDGADAVMLSAETSVGAHPAHVVATIGAHRGGRRERDGWAEALEWTAEDAGDAVFGDAIAAAACEVGRRLGAAALCCFTRSGDTAFAWPGSVRRCRC